MSLQPLNLLAMRADSKKMQQEIAALRKEIDELNESEGSIKCDVGFYGGFNA